MTTENKTIPVAYVTKWATTRDIVIVRNAELIDGQYLRKDYLFENREHWTENKSIAEARWRAAMLKSAASAAKKAARLTKAAEQPPKYTER